MKIEHGPPGASGVTQLAYMGELPDGSSWVALAALATAGYAVVARRGEARRDFLVAAGGMWLISMVL